MLAGAATFNRARRQKKINPEHEATRKLRSGLILNSNPAKTWQLPSPETPTCVPPKLKGTLTRDALGIGLQNADTPIKRQPDK